MHALTPLINHRLIGVKGVNHFLKRETQIWYSYCTPIKCCFVFVFVQISERVCGDRTAVAVPLRHDGARAQPRIHHCLWVCILIIRYLIIPYLLDIDHMFLHTKYFTFNKTPPHRDTAAIPLLCLSHEKVTTYSTLYKWWFENIISTPHI